MMITIQNKTPTEIEEKRQKYLEYQRQYRATHKKEKQQYMKDNKDKLAEFQRKYDRERRANKDEKYITALKERQKRYRDKKKIERKAEAQAEAEQILEQ